MPKNKKGNKNARGSPEVSICRDLRRVSASQNGAKRQPRPTALIISKVNATLNNSSLVAGGLRMKPSIAMKQDFGAVKSHRKALDSDNSSCPAETWRQPIRLRKSIEVL